MNDISFASFVLLIISEYGELNTAMEAESELVKLLNQMTEDEAARYQEQADHLLNFNRMYMETLTGKEWNNE